MEKYYWCFDKDQEVYTNGCDTVEQCISEARRDSKLNNEIFGRDLEKLVHIGETQIYMMPVVDSETLLEDFRERAYDDCGESSEGWLFDYSKEQALELDEMLTKIMHEWIKETGQEPYFSTFKSIETYDLDTGENIDKDLEHYE